MTTDNYCEHINDFTDIENINAEIFITVSVIKDFKTKLNNCDDEIERNFYKTNIDEWIRQLNVLMKHQ